mgnify:CR=1 FL=1
MRNFLLRWGCNVGELLSQFNEPDFGSLPISIIGIEIIAEGFDLRLDLEEFIKCHFDNIVLQELLFPELSLLDLSGLLKFPFLFRDEMGQHVTLARCQMKIRHRSVWVLVPEINVVEHHLRIQKQWHICAFGSSGPFLPVSDDICKFFIISFIVRGHMEGSLFLLRTRPRTSSSSGLCLQQSGA